MEDDMYVEITDLRCDTGTETVRDSTSGSITTNAINDATQSNKDLLGMSFWCQRCKEMRRDECVIHGKAKLVADTVRPTLAVSSLPSGLYLGSKGGVFSKKMFPINTVFGPFIAPRSLAIDDTSDLGLHLPVDVGNSVTAYLTPLDEEACNWMMFVSPAQTWSEINLILYESQGHLYFVCVKSLQYKGSELKYGYAEPYAKKYSLPLLKRDEAEFSCDACDLNFPSNMLKMRHCNSSKCLANQKKAVKPCAETSKSFPESDKKPKEPTPSKKSPQAIRIIKEKRRSALRSVRCRKCKLGFDNRTLLSLHKCSDDNGVDDSMKTSDLEEATNCPDCHKPMESYAALKKHVSDTHGNPFNADDTFESLFSETNSLNVSPSKGERDTPPSAARQSFEGTLTMDNHAENQEYQSVLDVPPAAPIKCNICFKAVSTSSQLAVHMKTHTEDCSSKFFKCFLCDERFKGPAEVRKHVVVHAVNGKYTCPKCPHREYDSWLKCRKHIYTLHSGKEFPCLECGRVFSRLDKLKIHALTHTNIKNHMCDVCGRQFSRKDKLQEHIRNVHNKEDGEAAGVPLFNPKINKFRPRVPSSEYHRFIYKCLDCSLGFKRRGMLVNHLAKVHPAKEMSSVPELNLPILREQRNYYCNLCSRSYKSSFKRKIHMLKCHPGASIPPESVSQPIAKYTTFPFACDFCHKQYANKAKLTEHIRMAHPEHPNAVVERIPRTFIQNESRLTEHPNLTTADLTNQDVVTLIQPLDPNTGEPMTIALQGINLGDNTRVDNNDLLTQALSANELQATFDFQQQQLGGMANQLGPGGGLELRVIQNPNLSIDLNSLQMSGLTNNSNITFTTVPVSSLNPVTSLHNPIISSTNNLPSLENTAVPLSAHSPKGPAWTSLSNLTQHRLL